MGSAAPKVAAIRIDLSPIRETKNTVVFGALDSQGEAIEDARLETLYVPKDTLEELGWQPDGKITVELSNA